LLDYLIKYFERNNLQDMSLENFEKEVLNYLGFLGQGIDADEAKYYNHL
jgi:hypothetical protein